MYNSVPISAHLRLSLFKPLLVSSFLQDTSDGTGQQFDISSFNHEALILVVWKMTVVYINYNKHLLRETAGTDKNEWTLKQILLKRSKNKHE